MTDSRIVEGRGTDSAAPPSRRPSPIGGAAPGCIRRQDRSKGECDSADE